MHNADVAELLRNGINVGRSAFQGTVHGLGRMADLVRKARQVLHHHPVACVLDHRSGLVQRLMEARGGAFNGVVDLGSQVGQPVLDARRDCCDAVGKVVRCRLEAFLDLW